MSIPIAVSLQVLMARLWTGSSDAAASTHLPRAERSRHRGAPPPVLEVCGGEAAFPEGNFQAIGTGLSFAAGHRFALPSGGGHKRLPQP